MARFKLAPAFAVLLVLTVFLGGMLSYKVLAGTGTAHLTRTSAGSPSARSETIGMQGKVAIRVYSASGRLLTIWKGHNAIDDVVKNSIAVCFSGASTTPAFYGSCSGSRINNILLCPDAGGACSQATTVNTPIPSGCGASPTYCTGWESTATIDIGTTSAYSLAYGRWAPAFSFFDRVSISPALSLNQGDRAVVTITVTVS